MKKIKRKPISTQQLILVGTTETEAGLHWINSLTETEFRDRILPELFRRMQAEGQLEGFENIHGRNDKGVDYIVSLKSAFGSTIRGIQVKSKPITRSESSGALSALRIHQECHAAMLHTFHFRGKSIRLEGIDVWNSSTITEDGEKELNPPQAVYHIGVQKDTEILPLIEKHCPNLLAKVPQFAITKYLSDSKNPGPKSSRILGCSLDPSVHFIEPFFGTEPPTSTRQLQTRHGALQARREKVSLASIFEEKNHTLFFAPALSGRSYLLEHLKCKFSAVGRLAVLFKASEIPNGEFKIETLISKHLRFISPKQVVDIIHDSGLVILIDDVDKVAPQAREILFSLDSKGIRIVGAARSMLVPSNSRAFYFHGVDWISIVRFLRTLDNKLASGKPFVDRAKVFIERAFETCGLPRNPFTIFVMLEECQQNVGKFSTPTMGRLIGRFIEHQIGSHIDSNHVVDFETKREFLTRLAGHKEYKFSILEFEKLLGRFIDAKGHPHSITDFSNDLLLSGVFQRTGNIVEWAHPVIKDFFWVKNLVSKNQLAPIQKRLENDYDITLAALVGSQLGDAKDLLMGLSARLLKISVSMPLLEEFVSSPEFCISLSKVMSDTDEESFLTSIEKEEVFGNAQPAAQATEQKVVLSLESKEQIRARMEPIAKRFADSKLHLAFNIAALILNARDTSRANKEAAVDAVITGCLQICSFTKDIGAALLGNDKAVGFISAWLGVVILCGIADETLGDPHLISIFKAALKSSTSSTRSLVLLDMLLCCGEDERSRIIAELKKINHLGVTMAFYWRVAMLYFFRFHRDLDRGALRTLLADIRRMEPVLPKVT